MAGNIANVEAELVFQLAYQYPSAPGVRLVTVPAYAFPDQNIPISCDGFMYHQNTETLDADAKKRNFLQVNGWSVLTYWGRTILRNPGACAQQIAAVYCRRP